MQVGPEHYYIVGISFTAEFSVVNTLNSAENEMRYIIVTATERGDRGESHFGFPSLTFQNPGGGNKPPKRRFLNKNDSLNLSLYFNILKTKSNHSQEITF